MEVLGLPPDKHTLEMAQLMREGAHARTVERRTEKIYRRALAELFDSAH
jgi:hypothetical protein